MGDASAIAATAAVDGALCVGTDARATADVPNDERPPHTRNVGRRITTDDNAIGVTVVRNRSSGTTSEMAPVPPP
jgi:hypothetical protein